MRLYISGPMTGLPQLNYPAFHAAADELAAAGYDVINPARPGEPHWEWIDWMRRAVRDVSEADGLALLAGWGESRGARVEVELAQGLGLRVLALGAWVRRAKGAGA